MKYEKNQYTEGFSFCGLIMAGFFFFWGINWVFSRSFSFSFIPGIIFIFIGLAIAGGQIAALVNRDKLRNAVQNELQSAPKASVEEISKSTGITRKDVQAIILDLKMRGELKGKFSSKTGSFKSPQAPSPKEKEVKATFCQACGSGIKKDNAEYCSYCGSKLD